MLSLKSTFNRNRQKKTNVWQLELSRFTQIDLSPFYFSVINFILEYYIHVEPLLSTLNWKNNLTREFVHPMLEQAI